MHMTLKKDAKVITEEALKDKIGDLHMQTIRTEGAILRKCLHKDEGRYGTHHIEELTVRDRKKLYRLQVFRSLLGDQGTGALLLGYDAIDVPIKDQLAVLNRSALRVSSTVLLQEKGFAP